jgi:hypothetical protein
MWWLLGYDEPAEIKSDESECGDVWTQVDTVIDMTALSAAFDLWASRARTDRMRDDDEDEEIIMY